MYNNTIAASFTIGDVIRKLNVIPNGTPLLTKPINIGTRIGFDFGEKRIGVATSDSESILVSPHATILNDEKLTEKLKEKIINKMKEFIEKYEAFEVEN